MFTALLSFCMFTRNSDDIFPRTNPSIPFCVLPEHTVLPFPSLFAVALMKLFPCVNVAMRFVLTGSLSPEQLCLAALFKNQYLAAGLRRPTPSPTAAATTI